MSPDASSSSVSEPSEMAYCPYKGLAPFTAEDEAYFFGRDKDAERIAASAITSTLTVLYGPSGVGKTSVLGAALPKALAGFIKGTFVVPFARWDAGFYAKLLDEVTCTAVSGDRAGITHDPFVRPAAEDATSQSVSLPSRSLEKSAVLWTRTKRTPVVFVFDQFEQYFINREAAGAEAQGTGSNDFETDLAHIANRRDLHAHILISIREDALFELNRLRARMPHILANTLRIDYLDEDSATFAVREPLRIYRKKHPTTIAPTDIEESLVSELLKAFARKGHRSHIETPYLQLALERLWRKEIEQKSDRLRLVTFQTLGLAQGIARGHFDDTMRTLTEADLAICARIFHHMITPSGMKIPLRAVDLAAFAGTDPRAVERVLYKLETGASKIIRSVPSPQRSDERLYEIFHDVLAGPVLAWKRDFEAVQIQAEQRRKIVRRYRRLSAMAMAFGMLMLITAIVVWTYRDANMQKARILAMRADQAIDGGDTWTGLLTAFASLPDGWISGWLRPITDASVDALVRALYRPLGQILTGHSDHVGSIGYNDDGSLIVTASRDGTARIWNAATGKVSHILPHSSPVTSASFSADGPYVATASRDGWAYMWNAQTGDKLAKWLIAPNNANNVHHVAISPRGNRIVSASSDRLRPSQVWTWSGVAQASPARLVALQDRGVTHDAGITSVAFDPTGSLIVTTSWDRTARIWDADNGRLLWELPASDSNPQAHSDSVLFARFSPDSRRVVTASGDGKARVWQIPASCAEQKCGRMPGSAADDTRAGVSLAVSLEGHSSRVTSAAFDVFGKQVITASSDGTVRLWSASGGELMRLLQGPAAVSGFGKPVAALRQDGRQIAATFSEKSPHLWQLPEAVEPLNLPGCGGSVTSAVVSGDDRLLATAFDQTVCILDVARKERLGELEMRAPVMSLAFGRDSSALAVALGPNAQIWAISRAKAGDRAALQRYLVGHTSLVLSVAFDRSGDRIITTSQDKTARIWDAQSGRSEFVLRGHEGAVFSAAFSSDGTRAATGSFDGTVRIWDAATGKPIGAPLAARRDPNGQLPVLAVTFTSDDRYVAATLLQRASPFRATSEVWDIASGHNLDGRSLKVANHFVVYSQAAGMRLPEGFTILSQNRDAIRNVVGSASTDALYSLSADGRIRVWPLPPTEPHALIEYARRVINNAQK